MLKLKLYAASIGVFLLLLFTFGKVNRRKGAQDNQQEQKEKDHETALDIRKRADAVKRVRDDDLEFRD